MIAGRRVLAGLSATVVVAAAAPGTAGASGSAQVPRVLQTGNSLPGHFVSKTWVSVTGLPSNAAPSAIDEENQWGMAIFGGNVYAWGTNQMDQLGTNGADASNRLDAVQVAGLHGISSLDGGRDFGLAVADNGSVYSWGSNEAGDLGYGSSAKDDPTPEPVDFPEGTRIVQVSAGNDHSLALDSTGHVWVWGDNDDGDLGLGPGDTQAEPEPVRIPSLSDIGAVSAGCDWSMALDTSGRVWTWGDNSSGQLGDGTQNDSSVPVAIPSLPGDNGLPTITAISAGGNYADNGQALALDERGHVWAWGDNQDGQLGIGSDTPRALDPVELPMLHNITSVSAGGLASVALDASGQLWVWGSQSTGQLGSVEGGSRDVRSPVASLAGVSAAWAGATGSLVIQ